MTCRAVEGESGLSYKFEDFDNKRVFDEVRRDLVHNEATKNFVVEFSFDAIKIAFNLDHHEMEELLGSKAPAGTVRWINVWTPKDQPLVIGKIGNRYGFSRRLQAVLAMSAAQPTMRNEAPSLPASESTEDAGLKDLESGPESSGAERPVTSPLSEDLEIYNLIKQTPNWTSVDQGDEFVCIGANWLHRRATPDEDGSTNLIPPKHWSWFTLCADNTVISIHDTPDFEHPDDAGLRRGELAHIRSNTNSILYQLSKHGLEEHKHRVLTLKSVREMLRPEQPGTVQADNTAAEVNSRSQCNLAFEGASNLFYYLFEDYAGALPVLKASRRTLKLLSARVFSSADRRNKVRPGDIIPALHTLSKELRQLLHLFEGYKTIIYRISRPRTVTQQLDAPSEPLRLSGQVKISQSARNRFERLGDRLQLLMLNTIREYLDEQSALSTTYFNLTAQKDSQATARLTRAATLLAKLSVFFLPINFMTSFFSVEIPGMLDDYTPREYWIAFGVLAGLSFIALFFFSRWLMFSYEFLENWVEGGWRQAHGMMRRRGTRAGARR